MADLVQVLLERVSMILSVSDYHHDLKFCFKGKNTEDISKHDGESEFKKFDMVIIYTVRKLFYSRNWYLGHSSL
jgi:hypothetical protein